MITFLTEPIRLKLVRAVEGVENLAPSQIARGKATEE